MASRILKNGQNCRFGARFKNDRQSASAKWDICSYISIVFLLDRSYVYYNVHWPSILKAIIGVQESSDINHIQ